MTNEEAIKHIKAFLKIYDLFNDDRNAIEKGIEALEAQNHFYTQVLSKIDDIVYDHTGDGGYKNIMSEIYELLGLDWSEVE